MNARDFRRLAAREDLHPGVILIPDGGIREEQLSYVNAATKEADLRFVFSPTFANSIVCVDPQLNVRWEHCSGNSYVSSPSVSVKFH